MVTSEKRIDALLRQRTAARRARQLWWALTAVWAVLVGWIVWGIVGSMTENDLVTWLAYGVPLALLVIGSLIASLRVRRVDDAITRA